MRVAIDIGSIPYDRGISRYTSNLVRALQAEKLDELYLFGSSFRLRERMDAFAQTLNLQNHTTIWPYPPAIMQILWNDWHVCSPEKELGNPDIFHSWEYQPPLKHAALVSTIHDLAMLRFPQTAHPKLLRVHKSSWRHLKRDAKAIIAVSEATKRDIVELLDFDPSLVHVVPEALPEESKVAIREEDIPDTLNKLGLEKPYLLFVGTTEPRKNLPRLIQAWKYFSKDYDLVIAGASGWESLTIETGIRLLGHVSARELAVLYAGASLFVYPSLYEGFGLPILEAFHYGAPVLTSSVSSMPEVAGDAAVYCNPLEVDSIRLAIEEGLEHRKKFIRSGNKRLMDFSWNDVAKQTMNVYEVARKLCE